jgi:hypothetical protein
MIALVLLVEDPPFDARILDPDIRAGEFVEGLEERCAAFCRNGLGWFIRLELRRFERRFGRTFFCGGRHVRHRSLLGQEVQRIECAAAAAATHLAGGLPEDLGGYAKRGATFGTLCEHC